MNTYVPDRWVVLEFHAPHLDQPLRKVFAGWYGGYTGSDSWQLNSGITSFTEDALQIEFVGVSGNIYRCQKRAYGCTYYMTTVLNRWLESADERGDIQIKVLTLDEIVKT
jgi:hypothetical protein